MRYTGEPFTLGLDEFIDLLAIIVILAIYGEREEIPPRSMATA